MSDYPVDAFWELVTANGSKAHLLLLMRRSGVETWVYKVDDPQGRLVKYGRCTSKNLARKRASDGLTNHCAPGWQKETPRPQFKRGDGK